MLLKCSIQQASVVATIVLDLFHSSHKRLMLKRSNYIVYLTDNENETEPSPRQPQTPDECCHIVFCVKIIERLKTYCVAHPDKLRPPTVVIFHSRYPSSVCTVSFCTSKKKTCLFSFSFHDISCQRTESCVCESDPVSVIQIGKQIWHISKKNGKEKRHSRWLKSIPKKCLVESFCVCSWESFTFRSFHSLSVALRRGRDRNAEYPDWYENGSISFRIFVCKQTKSRKTISWLK